MPLYHYGSKLIFSMYVGVTFCTVLWPILGMGWEGGVCDVRGLADGLPLTMYHVRVVGVPCVPLSDPRGFDPP